LELRGIVGKKIVTKEKGLVKKEGIAENQRRGS